MSAIARIAKHVSRRARRQRAALFRSSFALGPATRILDLGSEDGSHIHDVLSGTAVTPANVYIADIKEHVVRRGQQLYGFTPVVIDQSQRLPFEDGYFDIVYSSSVIEHVTVPKEQVWGLHDGGEFRERAWRRQGQFADEIRRLGRQYFVQTPSRTFPIECHTWLPGVAWLPRWLLVPCLRLTNRFWIKSTAPDWNLLSPRQLASLFADGRIVRERFLGLTKSIMAVKTTL
jgi:SAM-dependent methyltransferase